MKMNRRVDVRDVALRSVLVAGLALGTAGCCTQALFELDPDQLTWVTYRNTALGYTLEYPSILRLRVEGGTALFDYGWGVPVLVRFTDESGGRNRSLWFGHEPVGPVELSGRPGELFIYEHKEGPSAIRTVSYVIPLEGKYLAFEFRTGGELNPVQKRMLDSFRMTDAS